ncbi:MAG: FAD-dependent oxidoreductase, partial [Pseudomonadales bacterium]|nr:FAD-dependent oxidoreductase [Pseudomonadales bacterium]
MIFSDSTPIEWQDSLPDSVDVVIIGAGVIGISTAWFLAKHGVSVLVCDKGRVAGEQSSRNWGWVRQQSRDAAELPIMIDSINTWESLSKELGEDIGFAREGVLNVAATDADLASRELWLDTARQHQLDTRMLSSAEVDELLKDKPGQWKGALFTASDGRAEPFKAVPALARGLRKQGGLIREA